MHWTARIFAFTLLVLPSVFGAPVAFDSPTRIPAVALIMISLVTGMIGAAQIRQHRVGVSIIIAAVPAFLLVALYAFAAFKVSEAYLPFSTKIGISTFLVTFTLSAAVNFSNIRSSDDASSLLVALLASLPLYMFFNALLLPFADARPGETINSIAQHQNESLKYLGVTAARIEGLPMIAGTNVAGVIAGLSVIVSAYLWSLGKRTIGILAFSVSFYLLLLTDARASFVAAVLLTILSRVLPKKINVVFLLIVAILAVPSSWFLYEIFTALNAGDLGIALTRSGRLGTQLGVGTGRDIIWSSVFHVFKSPEGYPIRGYGYFGQATSGAIYGYLWMFGNSGTVVPSVHNAYLQVLIDIGLIGVLTYFVLWVSTIVNAARCARKNSRLTACLTACLIFISVNGFTEVAGTPYHSESFVLLLGLAIGMTALAKSKT